MFHSDISQQLLNALPRNLVEILFTRICIMHIHIFHIYCDKTSSWSSVFFSFDIFLKSILTRTFSVLFSGVCLDEHNKRGTHVDKNQLVLTSTEY